MIERAPAPSTLPAPIVRGGFFGTGSRARFGWVHAPAAPNGAGLVIVPPFGYEAICAHRSLRAIAGEAARAGVIAVRADLDGTGDSAGDDLDPDRVDAWLASIDDACELARGSGADRLVLAGVRLGASLAALAAERRDDVAGLVAIAAVPSGKALVREGRALQMQLGLERADAATELVGFALAPETRDAIARIDLLRATKRPAPRVLVVDRDDLAANTKWLAALGALGADVAHARVPGYVEMVLDPHRAKVPRAIVDATVAFAAAAPPAHAKPHAGSTPPVELVARAEIQSGDTSVTEELVALDDRMIAIASRLRATPRRAIVLLDAGAIYRIGPNRLHVALARRLARDGDLVLRIDQSGIGDSTPRDGAPDDDVYGPHAIADVGVAVAYARRAGAQEVAVVGLCSGAYHALKAAVAGQPIDTVVAINPLTFFWKPGMPLDFAAFRVTADAKRYEGKALDAGAWRRVLRGEVDLRRAARVIAERARAIAVNRAKDLARRLRVPLPDDLGSELLAVARRGVAVRFVFASGDPGLAMLREQGGSAVARLEREGALAITTIDGPDHTFTPRWSQPLLLDAIARAVQRRPEEVPVG
jgi:alpha/beta superfamily hydrolase